MSNHKTQNSKLKAHNSKLIAQSKNKIMKKTLLLTLALLLSVTTFAQKRGTLLKENFDSPTMPEGWTITGGYNQNWSVSESKLCGGEAYEMKLSWTPVFYNAFTRLTSPALDLTGVDEIMVSFKHYVDIYTTFPSTIGIATSTNGSNWSVCYEQTFTSDGQHNISQIISNDDMGKENVMICLFYKGNSANINAVYFDDIEVMTIENTNVKIESIDTPVNISSGDTEITFTLQNLGVEEITTFEAKYDANGQTYSQTFETNIANLEAKQFVFGQKIALTPGKYDVTVEVTSVNNKEDEDVSNNTLEKEINVALGSSQRIPLIEHFSSSTCGPCVSVNNAMHTLTNNNVGKFTYVKYPLGFPAPGDAYNTAECNVRKEYYYVTAAPNVVFNGSNIGSSPISQYQLDNSYNDRAFVNIKGAFNVEGNIINITADVMSYINLNNMKAFVTVNEKTTTGNEGTNGEKEFHHIMLKMLNDANGNEVNINLGESHRLEFTYDMSETHVEEMNDLEVAVWIQNHVTGEVFNSSYLYEYAEHPYPARNLNFTKDNDNINITWEAPEKGEPTGYNLYVNNELVAQNTKEFSHSLNKNDVFCVEVVALYNGMTSVGLVKTTSSEEDETAVQENLNAASLNIYPNPANDVIYIESGRNVEKVTIYDIYGRQQVAETPSHQDNLTIDVANLNSGIYFIQIKTEKENIVKRFIKE